MSEEPEARSAEEPRNGRVDDRGSLRTGWAERIGKWAAWGMILLGALSLFASFLVMMNDGLERLGIVLVFLPLIALWMLAQGIWWLRRGASSREPSRHDRDARIALAFDATFLAWVLGLLVVQYSVEGKPFDAWDLLLIAIALEHGISVTRSVKKLRRNRAEDAGVSA